ncbi:hypothetical protein CR513_50958, partial [Mucuna pruriens]
ASARSLHVLMRPHFRLTYQLGVAPVDSGVRALFVLIKLYEIKLLHTRIFLKRKLYTLRMGESMLVIDQINHLNTLFSQLTMSDFNIAENQCAKLLFQI